ncbi:hypothetical protein DPV78_007098 [Talaromyces pinophilus]|nr:hypothetical protein DPV78_007098 [Talaromyces pinophilus]
MSTLEDSCSTASFAEIRSKTIWVDPIEKLEPFYTKCKVESANTTPATITTHIHDVCGKEGFEQWTRSTQEEDKLYQDDHRHKHHQLGVCTTCDACLHDEDGVCSDASSLSCAQLGCDEHCLVLGKHRNVPTPEVHFGLMGSATHRNRIAHEESLLGFDMEAAGMWDNFPTIVAKAVCDYAESHKNKS